MNQPDFRKLPVVDQEMDYPTASQGEAEIRLEAISGVLTRGAIKNSNVIDFDRFKEKTSKPSDFSRNEILLQSNISRGDAETEPKRGVVISRYRQAQESLIYLKNNPVVEMKI